MSSDVVAILLHALHNAPSRSIRQNAARLLGEVSQLDDSIIASLQQGLLDEDSDVRTSCVEALAQLGHHFPDTAASIGSKLVQAIEDPNFNEPDNKKGRSAQEYAFNGLWRMVVSGEVVSEEY